jgi:hypothetical protein
MSILGFAYSSNGTQWRYSFGNDLVGGEVWFQFRPDPNQIAAAFPGYPAVMTSVLGLSPQYAASVGANAIAHGPAPTAVVAATLAVPVSNPGATGALFIASNTLFVSQGPTGAAVQIGATGPTGAVVI